MAMRSHSLSDLRPEVVRRVGENGPVHPGWFAPLPEVEEDHQASTDVLFEVFTQILKIAGSLDRSASDALEDLSLTAGAFNALVELGKVGDKGIAPSELARRLAVARRTATLYVDILTRQGWAVRESHPDDRRMVLARLSDKGRELLATDGPRYQARLAELLGEMTPVQAERLRQLLDQIIVEIRV